MDIDLWYNNTNISKLYILSAVDLVTLMLISVSDFEKIVSNVGLKICRLIRMYWYNDFCLAMWYLHIITAKYQFPSYFMILCGQYSNILIF